jgi:hypothetical protein
MSKRNPKPRHSWCLQADVLSGERFEFLPKIGFRGELGGAVAVQVLAQNCGTSPRCPQDFRTTAQLLPRERIFSTSLNLILRRSP